MAGPFQQLLQPQTLIHPLKLKGRVGRIGLRVDEIRQVDDSHLASCVIPLDTLHHEGCPLRKVSMLRLQRLEHGLVAHDMVDIGSLNNTE